jgi:hypothetical protein
MTESQAPASARVSRARPKSVGLRVYEKKASYQLRMLIAQKNLRLKVVSAALEKRGIRESEKGLSAKIAQGTFSAAYFLAIREVIDSL